MSEMTTKELTAYLKTAAELEASVYRQTEAKKAADRCLVYNKPSKRNIPLPEDPAKTIEMPCKPEEIRAPALAPLGIFGALCVIASVGLFSVEPIFGVFEIAIGLSLAGFAFFQSRNVSKQNAENLATYEAAKEEYNTQVARAKKVYALNMENYKRECALADSEYGRHRKLADRNFAAAKESVHLLNTPLDETKQALEQLYAHDIIFPKYRDLVAMCTMYEYFASGRCTELTGPNGAYNLYEAELRQNLIINRLDTIISNLEQIRQNQYMLYQEIRTTNTILNDISSDVRQILKSTQEIAEASKINAYCAQVTAQNTEALKYIALIN